MLTQTQKDKRVAVAQKAVDELKKKVERLSVQAAEASQEWADATAELKHRMEAPVKAEKSEPVNTALGGAYQVTDIR